MIHCDMKLSANNNQKRLMRSANISLELEMFAFSLIVMFNSSQIMFKLSFSCSLLD